MWSKEAWKNYSRKKGCFFGRRRKKCT